MKLYPLRFKEIYKQYLWGGKGFEKLGKVVDKEKVGESWEITCHKDGMSIVSNGELKGKSLKTLMTEYGVELVGNRAKDYDDFPLLIKFINAKDKLSVQVHPDDEYGYKHEGEQGKNEAWVVLDAEEDATMIVDVATGTSKETFIKAIDNENIESCLNFMNVKAGDIIDIPAGLVHAIGEGIILAEIQQNSNTTYRVYDYNRKDSDGNQRELHVNKALDVIDFSDKKIDKKAHGITLGMGMSSIRTIAVANKYFCIETFVIDEDLEQETTGETFLIYIFTKGVGKIVYSGNSIDVKMGDTILVPASMGEFTIIGKMQFVKSYIPNIEKDIFEYLGEMGYSRDCVAQSIDGLS